MAENVLADEPEYLDIRVGHDRLLTEPGMRAHDERQLPLICLLENRAVLAKPIDSRALLKCQLNLRRVMEHPHNLLDVWSTLAQVHKGPRELCSVEVASDCQTPRAVEKLLFGDNHVLVGRRVGVDDRIYVKLLIKHHCLRICQDYCVPIRIRQLDSWHYRSSVQKIKKIK